MNTKSLCKEATSPRKKSLTADNPIVDKSAVVKELNGESEEPKRHVWVETGIYRDWWGM